MELEFLKHGCCHKKQQEKEENRKKVQQRSVEGTATRRNDGTMRGSGNAPIRADLRDINCVV